MKTEIIKKYNPYTIFEYNGKLYFSPEDDTENLYDENGSIVGKAYQEKCAKIISNSKIIYNKK